jgi:soluble lytic murein transglycosylase-like protein
MRGERRLALRAAALAAALVCATSHAATVSTRVAQAIAYEHGEGVPKDAQRAAALYCEAARDGDLDALYGLGWMYANGRGVARDDAAAAALLARAAARGHQQARNLLALVGPPGALPACMTPPAPVVARIEAPWQAAEPERDPFAELPPAKRKIADLVRKVAPRYAVDPALALAVIAAESNFDPSARSPKDARGLMQLIPETAARFNVRDAFDVHQNMRGGLSYLRWLLAYYRGEVALVAAAYNAGEKAVDRHRGIPPYPETREYVQRILALFRRTWHPYEARAAAERSPLARDKLPERAGPVRSTAAGRAAVR